MAAPQSQSYNPQDSAETPPHRILPSGQDSRRRKRKTTARENIGNSCAAISSRAVLICCLVILLVVTSVLGVGLLVHRGLARWQNQREWLPAPILHLERSCPGVPYKTTQVAEMPVMPKICLTTLTDENSSSRLQRLMRWRNFDGILALTWENKQKYCHKHGYQLYDGSVHVDPSRPPAWSKIKAVQYLLLEEKEDCDWVMWTDADTVIMNSDIAITDFLPASNSHDLIVAPDKGGGYNSGVFVFRKSAWSLAFLEEWWNMTKFVRPPGLSLSGDNNAMKSLLNQLRERDNEFSRHVLSPPRCTFNSFAKFLSKRLSNKIAKYPALLGEQEWYLDNEHYHRGDFIAHTPGVDNKAACIKVLLQYAQ